MRAIVGSGQLFDVTPRRRHRGTRALALRDTLTCACGPVYRGRHIQPALFVHGGYGAAERITSTWCLCGRLEIRDTAPVNPRTLT